jgi:hypothetical protein
MRALIAEIYGLRTQGSLRVGAIQTAGPGWPLYQLRQRAWPLDRAFVSEPVCLGRYGRVAFEGRGVVCQPESGSSSARVSRRGVVMVERTGPPCRRG